MTTIRAIVNDVIHEVGKSRTDADTRALFDMFALEAAQEIIAMEKWPALFATTTVATVADTATITLDADVAEVTSLGIDGNYGDLDYEPLSRIAELGHDLDETGEPIFWYRKGLSSGQQVVGLWPIPDAEYTIRVVYAANSDSLTATSEFPFPAEFNTLLKHLVRIKFFGSVGAMEQTQFYQMLFESLLGNIRRRYLMQSTTSIRRFGRKSIERFPPAFRNNWPIVES